jgi:hypothetical protein
MGYIFMCRKNRQRIAITIYSGIFFLFLFALVQINPPQRCQELNAFATLAQ